MKKFSEQNPPQTRKVCTNCLMALVSGKFRGLTCTQEPCELRLSEQGEKQLEAHETAHALSQKNFKGYVRGLNKEFYKSCIKDEVSVDELEFFADKTPEVRVARRVYEFLLVKSEKANDPRKKALTD